MSSGVTETALSCARCGKPANLQCPKCVELKLPCDGAAFCTQDCFKASWSSHKSIHLKAKVSSRESDTAGERNSVAPNDWLYCLRKGQSRTPKLPSFDWTGTMKPYPISKPRLVRAHIDKPDWATDGTPKEEPSSDLQRVVEIKTPQQIERMRETCRIAREVLDAAARVIRPGVTTDEIDAVVHEATIAAAAEELDSRPGMEPTTTKRMFKRAEKAKIPTGPRIPSFLEGCSQQGKRGRSTDGSIRSPFIPTWGICEQDSALESPALALDWSKCSITPLDLLTVTAGDKIEESELLGAQALYQANAYFQSVAYQGRAYRDENVALHKEKSRFEEEYKDLESRALRAEKEASSYQRQLNSLTKKKSTEFHKVVEAYHQSESFLNFIDKHDDEMRPFNMTIGWDRAVNVISNKYPDVVNPVNFPGPDWAVSGGCYVDYASGSKTKVVSQTSGSGSKGGRQPSGSSLKGATRSVSSGSHSSSSHGKRPISKESSSSEEEEGVEEEPMAAEVEEESSSGVEEEEEDDAPEE